MTKRQYIEEEKINLNAIGILLIGLIVQATIVIGISFKDIGLAIWIGMASSLSCCMFAIFGSIMGVEPKIKVRKYIKEEDV